MDAVRHLADTVRQDMEDDQHARHLQLYVSQHGQLIFHDVVGSSGDGATAVPDLDTTFILFSLSKPLLALRIMGLWDRQPDLLRTPVSQLIPEFASHGKAAVEIRDLLCHAVCYAHDVDRVDEDISGPRILASICSGELAGPPGEVVGYSARNSWIVLARCVSLLTGDDAERQILQNVARPLGLNSVWFTRQQGNFAGIQPPEGHVYTVPAPSRRRRDAGRESSRRFVELDHLHAPLMAEEFCPGTGAHASAGDVGRLLEYVLGVREVTSPPASARARLVMRSVHRSGVIDQNYYMEARQNCDVRMGYGLVVDGRDFSPLCSPQTFGLAGLYNFACADPVNGLVVAAGWDTAVELQTFWDRRCLLFRRLHEILPIADG